MTERLTRRLSAFTAGPFFVPLLLLLLCILSYGLLIPWLGFYWDEWPINWIAQKLGGAGLERYFETNRPLWGLIYRLTTPLLGSLPWRWLVFGLVLRWLSALGLWLALRQVWPGRRSLAAWAALFFAVYPGFGQQSIALMYSHFFIVLSALMFSLWLSLLGLQHKGRSRALLTAAALLLSAVNLLTLEYFFLLELLRPLFLWAALGAGNPPWRLRLRRTFTAWLPFLGLFLAVVAWRAFFFPYQTHNYQPMLLAQLSSQPAAALNTLFTGIGRDLWAVTVQAWQQVFVLPDAAVLGGRTTLVYAGVLFVCGGLLVLCLLWLERPARHTAETGAVPALEALVIGLAGLLIGGWPFWLTGLPIGLGFPNDRFTLPFMLGASLLLAGLLSLLPPRRWAGAALAALLLTLAAGYQFQQASAYRRDWNTQKLLFWQMAWRMPSIEPGTAVVSNDLPLRYFSDNSLAAPLNWIWAPENASTQMSYMFYYASVRSTRALRLQPGQPIRQGYLAADFDGSSDRLLVINFDPPACLRLLDPEVDAANPMLPGHMRQAAALSNPTLVHPASPLTPARLPQPDIFGVEPDHGWCYYFEKAGLARQQSDWPQVAALGAQALALADHPNDPAERLVFIEGFAQTGDLAQAAALTRQTIGVTGLMRAPLCRLWGRIARQTPPAAETTAMLTELSCGSGD